MFGKSKGGVLLLLPASLTSSSSDRQRALSAVVLVSWGLARYKKFCYIPLHNFTLSDGAPAYPIGLKCFAHSYH
jgi:hypothetical protein